MLLRAAAKNGEAAVKSSLWMRYLVCGRARSLVLPTTTVATPEKFLNAVRSRGRIGDRPGLGERRGGSATPCWVEEEVSDGDGDGISTAGTPCESTVAAMLRGRAEAGSGVVGLRGRWRNQTGVSMRSSLPDCGWSLDQDGSDLVRMSFFVCELVVSG